MTPDEKLDKLIKDVTEIRVVLKGYNGREGLCEQVENQGRHIHKLWLVIIAMAASGGGGAYGIVRLILG